jgi:(heptosyl)LPS beta-1,4-glucosyltransferase
MGKSMKLSAIVIARNEEARIVKCLSSLAWVDEIVVVDNGSIDNTREIAKQHGATVTPAGDVRTLPSFVI